MAVDDSKYIYIRYFVLAVVFLAAAAGMPLPLQAASPADSLAISPVSPTVPRTYDELLGAPLPADLGLPRNVVSSVEYDAESGCYVLRTRVGDKDIATPFILTSSQYARWRERNERRQRFRMLDGGPGVDNDSVRRRERRQFDLLDMNFDLGPLDRIFGPGGVRLTTTGSVQITTAVKSTKTDNPALSLNSRRKTFFDFDQKIQATVAASVGDRMKFNLNYNTDATFDFDSKNLKLQYEGTEDDIVRNIEAGNVSMTTGSSLIRGSTALFGIKSTLQFGRLTATALVSQQNSETRSINTRGGVQTTAFSLNADEYDANRHYFLAQYFRDHYDEFASRLPYVGGGINITRIEVWITNKGDNYSQSRNLTAFMDLAETTRLASDHWTVSPSATVPSNTANNLLQTIKNDYPTARFISSVSQALAPLGVFGIQGGTDYEKVESARLLSESEYTLNPTLGYISLKSQLAADEVLASTHATDDAMRTAHFFKGKSLQAGGDADGALAHYRKAAEARSRDAAEARYQIAAILFAQNKLDAAEKEVFAFSEANLPYQYWMGKAFLILGDIYVAKNDAFQAKATYQSIVDGYSDKTDGVVDEARQKIEALK